MKKMFLMLLFLGFGSIVKATPYTGFDSVVDLIPSTTTTISSSGVNNSSAVVQSPGIFLRNCLDYLVAQSTAGFTLTLRDGSSVNIFQVNIGTTTNVVSNASTPVINMNPFIMTWPTDNPLCASYNQTFSIIASTGAVTVNYRGQIRGRP